MMRKITNFAQYSYLKKMSSGRTTHSFKLLRMKYIARS